MRMYYSDFTPRHVYLGHPATRARQDIICALQERCRLHLAARGDTYGWVILTDTGEVIGSMSRAGTSELAAKRISPSRFEFQPGEVTLRAIFHHVETDDVTGDVLQDWFVPIPQIRVCR